MKVLFAKSGTTRKRVDLDRLAKHVLARIERVFKETGDRRLSAVKPESGGTFADHADLANWISREGEAAVAVVIEDQEPDPDCSPWMELLEQRAAAHKRLPPVVYVTWGATPQGEKHADRDPLVAAYIGRYENPKWPDDVATEVIRLLTPPESEPGLKSPLDECPETSPAIRKAIVALQRVLAAPYGLVTGPVGTGKVFLIRKYWQELAKEFSRQDLDRGVCHPEAVEIVSCGGLCKEYYGPDRRVSYDGEDFALVNPMSRAERGLLILHHVELLPRSIQYELSDRMEQGVIDQIGFIRLSIPKGRLKRHLELRLVATSEFSPAELKQSGRLVPDFFRRLVRNHAAIPTLELRRADIPGLVHELIPRVYPRWGLTVPPPLTADHIRQLQESRWPENISGLVRALDKLCEKCKKGARPTSETVRQAIESSRWEPCFVTWDECLTEAKKKIFRDCYYGRAGRDISTVARLLNLNRPRMYATLEKLGLASEFGLKTGKR